MPECIAKLDSVRLLLFANGAHMCTDASPSSISHAICTHQPPDTINFLLRHCYGRARRYLSGTCATTTHYCGCSFDYLPCELTVLYYALTAPLDKDRTHLSIRDFLAEHPILQLFEDGGYTTTCFIILNHFRF